VFLDHSVVEVFANGHTCLTSRIYPSRTDSTQVQFSTRGGSATLKSLDAWQMENIWNNGK
jgi:beta-fructofuranosidase